MKGLILLQATFQRRRLAKKRLSVPNRQEDIPGDLFLYEWLTGTH
jgi:hypothetical protein